MIAGQEEASGMSKFFLRTMEWGRRYADWLVLIGIVLFFVLGIATLHFYGMTWDEGLGNFFYGERYLKYLTSFQEKYLDFKADLSGLKNVPLPLFASPFKDLAHEFPPFTDILSAASMYVFSYRLGWLDAVDGFHAFKVFLAAIFLWTLYRFFAPRIGKFATLMGVLFLATFPRFWADMHFNPKDIPEMIFFGFTLMAYLVWYEKPRWINALLVGVLFGGALATKANAVFIPIVLILGVWTWKWNPHTWLDNLIHIKNYLFHYILMAVSGVGFYFLSWPYLYADPSRVKKYWDYILSRGVEGSTAHWNWLSPLKALAATPEWMLILTAVGLAFVLYKAIKDENPIWKLMLAWFIVPILRISLPGMSDFDGIRHFMEYLPAQALIAGYGAAALVQVLARNRKLLECGLRLAVVSILALNQVWIFSQYRQFGYLYYNQFFGGFSNTERIFGSSEATDYWASTYRQGMTWLAENAEDNSSLYVPIADWLVDLTGPLYLRPDIQILDGENPDSIQQAQGTVYVMFITRSGFYDEVAKDCAAEKDPVYEILVQGVPIMQIYQLETGK